MRQISAEQLHGLAADITAELGHLRALAQDIAGVQSAIDLNPGHARLFYENLALKLHNFYTGCERIFQTIVAELNGAPPTGFDWHRRLLDRMSIEWQGRPPVLSAESAVALREYLAFRHVVRNIYGYELDIVRIARLVDRYTQIWAQIESELVYFVAWIEQLAQQLDAE